MHECEETIFCAASQISDAEQRALYLKSACGDDLALRERIHRLIEAERDADAFLAEDPLELERLGKPASAKEAPGMIVGRYKLLQQIGEGGCGVVYMAEQEHPIRRRVALKVIKLGMDTKQVIARFEAERQALAIMDHPNIAKVLDAGATDAGHPYFVMELVRGIKITKHCDENNLSTRERLELFIKVVQAVQHAHQKGIIHRDIKPSNILVTLHDGVPVPKVIDFGIAKATEQKLTDKTLFTAFEQFIGTPAYVSPEQAEMSGLDIDTRTDIYSLGVLLYEMLVGRTPFDSRELQQSGLDGMRRIIRENEPVTPSTRLSTMVAGELTTTAQQRRTSAPELIHLLHGDLDWIVMKCLEKDRTRRYETANALSLDVERHLKNEPVLARAPSNLYRFGKFVRRNKLLFSAATAVVAALALATVMSTWQWQRAEKHASEERRYRERAEMATTQARAALAQMEAVHLARAEELVQGGERVRALPYWALILRQNPDSQLAARRLLSTLTERPWAVLACAPLVHSNRVTSAVFSRTGTRIVTAASDHTAAVWDAATGARVCGPLQHDASIDYAELSADDSLVITASKDHTMRLWNAVTGVQVSQPLRFERDVAVAKISPTQSHFAAVERHRRIHTGRIPLAVNEQNSHFDTDADEGEFSSDGRLFAGNSIAGNVIVVDVVEGTIVANLRHPARVRASTFHPGGTGPATACDDGRVRVWDIRTAKEIRTFAHSGPVTTAEFSRDGNYLATGDDTGVAQVWDVGTGKLIGKPLRHLGAIRSAGFSPDGGQIVTSSSDATARIWDVATGKPLSESIVHSYPLFWAQFDASGQHILTAGRGDAACVWSVPKSCRRPCRDVKGVQAAEFSPDGRSILITSSRGVEEFDAEELELVRTFTTNEPARGLPGRYVGDGSHVALYRRPNAIQLIDTRTGTLTRQIPTVTNLSRFAITVDRKWLLTASRGHIELLDLARSGPEAMSVSLPHSTAVQTTLLSPDSQHLLTAAADGLVRVWSLAQVPQLLYTLQTQARIQTAAYISDGLQIATTDADLGFRVWDSRTGKPAGPNIVLGSRAYQSSFSPNGRRLAVRVGDPVWLFDPATGKRVAGPITHAGLSADTRLAFTPDSGTLVTSGRGGLHFWNSEDGVRIGEPMELDSDSRFVGFSPKMDWSLCVSTNGILSVRKVVLKPFSAPAWLPAFADALAAAKFGEDGRTVPLTPIDLWKAQQHMMAGSSDDPLAEWVRWFCQAPTLGTASLGTESGRYVADVTD